MGLLGAFALQFTLLLWFTASFASPLQAHRSRGPTTIHRIVHTVTRDLVVNEDTGTVVDSETERSVDQGSASDGAGSGFDVPAILWLSFGLVVGLYLTLAGMRLWKMTTAFATGLVFAVCVWVTIVNVINAAGLGDLALTLVTLISFALGSLGGLLMSLRLAGLTALSILGGMSVGMRLVLIREGLLFSSKLGLNWIVVVVCAVAGFAVTLLRQRIGTALSCTFTGTFLLSLGIDLAVNKQNGVSRGLRHLLDGNDVHIIALRQLPYKPPISTQIILSTSIGLAFAMAYVQFRFFSDFIEEPSRSRPLTQYLPSIYPTSSADKMDMDTLRLPLQKPPEYHANSRFSL